MRRSSLRPFRGGNCRGLNIVLSSPPPLGEGREDFFSTNRLVMKEVSKVVCISIEFVDRYC